MVNITWKISHPIKAKPEPLTLPSFWFTLNCILLILLLRLNKKKTSILWILISCQFTRFKYECLEAGTGWTRVSNLKTGRSDLCLQDFLHLKIFRLIPVSAMSTDSRCQLVPWSMLVWLNLLHVFFFFFFFCIIANLTIIVHFVAVAYMIWFETSRGTRHALYLKR